jgi:phosphate transport system substrate-binding protein
VNKQSAERPEVAAFIEFYLRNGSAIAKIAKYIPLPESAYQQVIKRFDERRAGTAFGGHSRFGMHIDDVLQLELK